MIGPVTIDAERVHIMKKKYVEAELSVVEFDSDDLILTSSAEEDNTPGGSDTPSGGGDYTDEGFSNYH